MHMECKAISIVVVAVIRFISKEKSFIKAIHCPIRFIRSFCYPSIGVLLRSMLASFLSILRAIRNYQLSF